MRNLNIVFIVFIYSLICLGCGKDTKLPQDIDDTVEDSYIDRIEFEKTVYVITDQESIVIKVLARNNHGVKQLYDLENNTLNIILQSDAGRIVSVDQKGLLTAIRTGSANITAISADGKLKASTVVKATINTNSTTGIDKPLTEGLIFSKNARLRTTSAVMQSFDVDSKGEIYYSQLNRKYRAYISYGRPNSNYSGAMTINYFGHVSNFTLEEVGDDRYIWIDNFSSKNSNGDYWGSPIVSRIKFVTGTTLNSWEATDNYYCGVTNISVAVDFERDMMTILGISTGDVITYRLSDAQKLEPEIFKIPIVYGGESNNVDDATEQRKTVDVLARDLRKLTPLGKFVSNRIGDVSWQGFDIHGGKFYQTEGDGNQNDGVSPSIAYLTVRDIHGHILEERTRVMAISDLEALKTMDITNTGYMEAEGVKIRNGVMYLGYASRNSSDERTGTILKYNPSVKNVEE